MEPELIQSIQQSIQALNHDYTQLAQAVAVLQTDVAWVKKFLWIIIGTTAGTLVGTFWSVVLHKRNNRNYKKDNE